MDKKLPLELTNIISDIRDKEMELQAVIKEKGEALNSKVTILDKHICEKLVFYKDKNIFQKYKNTVEEYLDIFDTLPPEAQMRSKCRKTLKNLRYSMDYLFMPHTMFNSYMDQKHEKVKEILKEILEKED